MNKQDIKAKVELLEQKISQLDKTKINAKESEMASIIQEQMRIEQEIAYLQWLLMTDEQKQEYRKSVFNMSKKMRLIKGSTPLENKNKNILEYFIEIYDLAKNALPNNDIPDNIASVLQDLLTEINKIPPNMYKKNS